MLAKATFFLPLRDNDGRDLSAEQQEVRKQVYDLFDGWTLLGYFEGAFRMQDGTQALDKSAAYVVVLEEGRIGELEAVLIHDPASCVYSVLDRICALLRTAP